MADDPTSSTGDAAAGMTGSRTAIAQAAREEAEEAARGARERMSAAAKAVTEAEERVRLGDETVTYEQLAAARHKLEVTGFAVQREDGRARGALEALNRARAQDLAAAWDGRAPALRAAIRDAAAALVQADQALYDAVTDHNDAAAATQLEIRRLRAPVLSVEPMSPLAFLQLKQLVSSERRQDVSMAVSLLPPDLVPAELLQVIHGRPFGRQTITGHGGDMSAAAGHRSRTPGGA